ncbi:glycosyltransferase family 1 protein [Listeria monocytogenes]|uniref:glycosyltransferase family 4 protein n=1 Tax=Listeria monocytogenes TaxID=1639 RepID=UPI0010BC25D0|nr:glycosyltransferase family 4 protein [Listeria monocytogenes]EAC4365702.1 glycosyltransferase family 1 protein [Listeria monocytogenes]EAD0431649.1 glycosyltransferase family 1 protein [Listeria monocytogenes]EAD4555897.1 glycosyltransferase family 1 protein [Listeria monocytogenes]EAE9169175.1 glycosyltransferase family 1 protein [Listeria monocytogenes]EAF0657151.1 glycosyltransferase family 1 protein [Listeria monocytogenes]
MEQKHIVMVSHDFLPNIGGIAVYVYELSKALVARGHRLTVLSKYESFSKENRTEELDGIRIIRVPIMPIKRIDDNLYNKRMRQLIKSIEKTEKVDVVHWQTLNKDAKMMQGIQVQALEVYTNHLSWFRMLYNDKNYAKIRKLIKEPDVIICPSHEIEQMTEDLFKQAKIVYLPNGVDEKHFMPDDENRLAVRKQYGISSQETVVVSTNRMEPVKGMSYLIEAIPQILNQYNQVTFLIAGDGSQLGQFEDKLKMYTNNSGKVIFTGRLTNQEIKNVINAADIYVQPSLMEGCSIAIIEAMSCGKSVIASNVGGNPDVISKETGLLVPAKSVVALKEAIEYSIKHPDECKLMGENSRERVENQLNWTVLAREIEQIYNSAKR